MQLHKMLLTFSCLLSIPTINAMTKEKKATKEGEPTSGLVAGQKDIIDTLTAMAAISKIAAEIRGTSKESTEWNPNPYFGRTNKGLQLRYQSLPIIGLPTFFDLLTPWGSIILYRTFNCEHDKMHRIFEQFNQHLELQFLDNDAETKLNTFCNSKRERSKFYIGKEGKTISETDLDKLRGTNTFVGVNLRRYHSYYKIAAVHGKKVPNVPIFKDLCQSNEALIEKWKQINRRSKL